MNLGAGKTVIVDVVSQRGDTRAPSYAVEP